ncbi:MAG: hypothetical protein WC430_02355 [Patescibacteria group bacterium]
MRVMLMEWANSLPELVDVASKLKENGHQILYWVRNDSHFKVDESAFFGTIFHSHIEAREGKPAIGLKLTDFEPLGSDIIFNFFNAESVFMYNVERYYPKKKAQEKKQLFYDLLRYWYGLTVKLKPDVAIFEEIPHHLHSHVAYSVLKFFNIKIIILNSIGLNNRLLITSDIKFNSQKLRLRMKENSDKDFNLGDLSPEIKININNGTNYTKLPTQTIALYNEQKIKNKNNNNVLVAKLIFWLKIFISFRIFRITYNFVKNRIGGNAKKEYLKAQKLPDFNLKYIYVPLHYQPEASTNILGGMFVNQINLIEILSASLPEGWNIYVKEHPIQFYVNGIGYNSYRFKGFYNRISNIKGVKIIPMDTDTFKLIEECKAVATVTGTAAWESVLRLKPALIFGDNWFQDCPGIFKVNNVEKCKAALNFIKNGSFKTTKQDIIRFLFSVEEATIFGNFSFIKSEDTVDSATNVDNIYKSIIESMK